MKTATSAFALTPAQGESAVGSEATSGASLDLVTQIAQSVCAALYERLHALQRAFHYLDVHGNGYISATDFEHAILLVLDKVRTHPYNLPRKISPDLPVSYHPLRPPSPPVCHHHPFARCHRARRRGRPTCARA